MDIFELRFDTILCFHFMVAISNLHEFFDRTLFGFVLFLFEWWIIQLSIVNVFFNELGSDISIQIIIQQDFIWVILLCRKSIEVEEVHWTQRRRWFLWQIEIVCDWIGVICIMAVCLLHMRLDIEEHHYLDDQTKQTTSECCMRVIAFLETEGNVVSKQIVAQDKIFGTFLKLNFDWFVFFFMVMFIIVSIINMCMFVIYSTALFLITGTFGFFIFMLCCCCCFLTTFCRINIPTLLTDNVIKHLNVITKLQLAASFVSIMNLLDAWLLQLERFFQSGSIARIDREEDIRLHTWV